MLKKILLSVAITALAVAVLVAMLPDLHNPAVKSADGSTSTVQDLIKQQEALNDRCRNGSGDDPKTQAACDERDKADAALKAAGWCFGSEGQAEYQKQWQQCQGGSGQQATAPSTPDNDQVQFNAQDAAHKAMLDQMDARTNACFARAIHGLLMNGVRSRSELLNFAENTCGQGLQRFLVMQGMPEAAARAYVRKGAEDVLAVELR